MKFGLPLLFPHQWNILKYIQKETEALASKELACPKTSQENKGFQEQGGRNSLDVMTSVIKSRTGLPELGKL